MVNTNIYFVYRKHQQTGHCGGVVRGVNPAAVSLPRPDELASKANRYRQTLRPDDPVEFKVTEINKIICLYINKEIIASCPPVYVLVELLAKEARFVVTQPRLISDRKLKKTQKKRTRDMLGKINEKWVKYSE